MIIDTHAHLMFQEFKEDLEFVLMSAKNFGLEKIINVGCGIESSEQALVMAREWDLLYATLGLHPYDADDVNDDLLQRWKDECQKNKKVVAIGETGLDFFKSKVSREKQIESFEKHIELAIAVDLPVIVHNRDADYECLNILRKYPDVRAVFHCYGSDLEFAKKVWGFGYFTSFTGIVTFKNASMLQEVVKNAPLDMFMVETDCPYLAPQSHRGKRNEPSYIVEVLEKIAEIKGMERAEVEELAYKNTLRFFTRII